MTRRRLIFGLLLLSLTASVAEAGVFNRKSRADVQKTKQLIEVLRSDPDEEHRRAAAVELSELDPKSDMNVLTALTGALQRDASAAVRTAAALAIGEIKPHSAQGGVALERAAKSDDSPRVRQAARDGLWEYHLNGYRSQKLAEMVTFQTAEPPLARASGVRPAAAVAPAIVLNPKPPKRSYLIPRLPPPVRVPDFSTLPPVVLPPGPIEGSINYGHRPALPLLTRPTFPLNRTEEPPLARTRLSPGSNEGPNSAAPLVNPVSVSSLPFPKLTPGR